VIRFFQIVLLAFVAIIVVSCANSITAPTGGPKDVTPPKVVETIPENGSANFNTNKFLIKFNEFVFLENVQTMALISPPMKKQPEFLTKGKSVQVKFEEELKPNTTYSVYFGAAIVDITEKNPIKNYTYIFSTGEYVDSLSLTGTVYNAFDLKPIESTFVMLYKDNNDTYYLSKTDAAGKFRFDGLADAEYLLFAINDKNSSYIFDQPGEEIAFLDTLVRPIYIEKPIVDTIPTDSLYSIDITQDSIIVIADSLLPDSAVVNLDLGFDLYMFLSPDTIQRLVKAEVIEKNAVRFAFSQPATNVDFEFVQYPLDSFMYVKDFSITKDTLYWYLNNPPNDSLELLLTQNNDTLGTVYLSLDTDKRPKRLRKKDNEKIKKVLSWKSNVLSNKLTPDKHLIIRFSQPNIRYNNLDSSLLVIGSDSIWDPEFIFNDSLNMEIAFPFDLQEDTEYKIHFPDSAFTSWNNIHTEEMNINFNTMPLSEYGVFIFNLSPEKKQNYVLQFLTEKEVVVREFLFNSDTSATFLYLDPGKYLAKIIFDNDINGIWSTGNYQKKKQPEKVIYFPKEIKVRANWDVEEEWDF